MEKGAVLGDATINAVSPALQLRLKKLEEILGKEVVLKEFQDDQNVVAPPIAALPLVTTSIAKAAKKSKKGGKQKQDGPQMFVADCALPRIDTTSAYDIPNLEVGVPAEDGLQFCPWKVAETYPHNYIGNRNRPHAMKFFDSILENRTWDFFYLYDPSEPLNEAQLLVPSTQFQLFLDDINKELGIALAIPGGFNAERFVLRFGQGGTPRPRFLKRNRDSKELDITTWPPIDADDVRAYEDATPLQQEDFKKRLQHATAPKIHDRKDKSRHKSAAKKKERKQMLKDMDALLGVKEDGQEVKDVVLVALDVEAIEEPPHPVSEIGLAILDLNDVREVDPGARGCDWWPYIKAHHLRTKEYSGLANRKYIMGCPDAFNFGESTFPPRMELGTEIMKILSPYLDAGREVILIGHGVSHDVQYLINLDVDLQAIKNVTSVLDTQAMHQAWQVLDNPRSLSMLLFLLDIRCENLHNAGNDAVYTLRAAIGISVERARPREVKDEQFPQQADEKDHHQQPEEPAEEKQET